MANRFLDLDGTQPIRENYNQISEGFDSVEAELDAAVSVSDSIQEEVTAHKDSSAAHAAEHITYTGAVAGASNLKEGLDITKGILDNVIIEGGDGTQAAAAAVSVSGTTYTTLKQRVDEEYLEKQDQITTVNAQLAEKAEQSALDETNTAVAQVQNTKLSKEQIQALIGFGDINKNLSLITLSMLSEEVLLALTGSAPVNAIPGALSVLERMLASKAVSVEKTNYLTAINPDLLKDQVIKEHGYWESNGVWTVSAGLFSIEGYIPVEVGTSYYGNFYTLFTYDASFARLGQVNAVTPYVNSNANVKYIRPNYQYSTTSVANAYFKKGGISSTYSTDNLLLKEANVGAGIITPTKLANSAVSTPKLQDKSVTEGKTSFLQQKNGETYEAFVNLLEAQTIKENGYFETNGVWVTNASYFSIEGYIDVSTNETITLNSYSVYLYDTNHAYIGQSTTPGSTYKVTNVSAAYIRPIYTYSKTNVAGAYFKSTRSLPLYTLSESIKAPTIQSTTKFMHMSSDDVISIFQDLTTNAASYTSIFNNGVLSFLRSMHLAYGMVFSGYCFYKQHEADAFDLSQCTNKFAQEFTANSSWLKFGFHSRNWDVNYSGTDAATAKADFELVMTELFRILGSWECMDIVPRLQNYAGNLASVNEFKNTSKFGIIGLLSAEDTRTSYYQTATQRDFLQKHDRLFDTGTNLTFFSTDFRLEDVSDVAAELAARKSNIDFSSRMNDLVIFTHEYLLGDQSIRTKIEQCCQFAVTNGYSFDFPMNKLLK